MGESFLQSLLSGLPLGPLRYFASTGSTNEGAASWAEAGAPNLALVVADEQTAGRGRLGRRWYTPAGAALAFSLVLRPQEILHFAQNDSAGEALNLASPRLAGLGALAVCTALEEGYGLAPRIKWPNDVLLGGRKAGGVLPELSWQGENPRAAILGIGINIAPHAVPPPADLLFPATCVEIELGQPVDRWILLREVLSALLGWLPRLPSQDFQQAWESRLAYRDERVQVITGGNVPEQGILLGLDPAGGLRLQLSSGEERIFQAGDLRLRPGKRI